MLPNNLASVEQVLLAVGEQVGHENLLFASWMNKAVVILIKEGPCPPADRECLSGTPLCRYPCCQSLPRGSLCPVWVCFWCVYFWS